jgi:hypothetical protein
MGATKRDTSGVFAAELKASGRPPTAALDRVSCLSSKGITFLTNKHLPEWTEVGVKMRLPQAGGQPKRQVDCHGVVVQCARRLAGRGFEVSLLFLDLPKRAAARLVTSPGAAAPTSISIAR